MSSFKSKTKLHLNPYQIKSRKRKTEWKRGIFRAKRTRPNPKVYLTTSRFRVRDSSGSLQRKIAFLLFLIAVGSLFYLLFFFPFWRVEKVTVAGADYSSTQDIEILVNRNLSGRFLIFPKNNIILLNPSKIANSVYREFAQIQKVEVKKEFPDVLKIQIIEKQPVAIWATGATADLFLSPEAFVNSDTTSNLSLGTGTTEPVKQNFIPLRSHYQENSTIDYYLLDAEGNLGEKIAPEKVYNQNLLIIYDQSFNRVEKRQKIVNSNFLKFLFQLRDILPLKTNLNIHEFIVPISDSHDLYLKTDKNYQIFFDTEQNLQNELDALITVLNEDINKNNKEVKYYIDLRVPGLVYYK